MACSAYCLASACSHPQHHKELKEKSKTNKQNTKKKKPTRKTKQTLKKQKKQKRSKNLPPFQKALILFNSSTSKLKPNYVKSS